MLALSLSNEGCRLAGRAYKLEERETIGLIESFYVCILSQVDNCCLALKDPLHNSVTSILFTIHEYTPKSVSGWTQVVQNDLSGSDEIDRPVDLLYSSAVVQGRGAFPRARAHCSKGLGVFGRPVISHERRVHKGSGTAD